MRRLCLTMTMLLLAGCSGPQPAILQDACGPTDQGAVLLTIADGATCPVAQGQVGLQFLISGESLVSLASTATLGTGDVDVSFNGRGVVTSSLSFTSYHASGPASGSYSVQFEDGSTSQGSFDATWCSVDPECL